MAMELWLLKDDLNRRRFVIDLPALRDEGGQNIRCPQCGWQPSPSSRWTCVSDGPPEGHFNACGTIWNTFATAGRCPGCSHQWQWTSCLQCGEWSLHDDWYEDDE
jgi:DNA-directed RNA polymerase subunit RPC12/RpoP